MTLRELLVDSRLTLVGLLLESHRGLIEQLRSVHERYDLQGLEFDALLRLGRSDGHELRMTDLATQTGVSTSGTTTLVDRLEARKLVQRVPSDQDRRSLFVRLTPAGEQLLIDDVTSLLPLVDANVIDPLGVDADVVRGALERVRDQLVPGARSAEDATSSTAH